MTLTTMEQENEMDAMASLAARFVGDREYSTRYSAVRAMASMSGPAVENVLLSVAENRNEDIDIRTDAILGLSRMASPASISRIEAFLTDPFMEMRKAAVTALLDRVDQVSSKALTSILLMEEMADGGGMGWNPLWDAQLFALKALVVKGTAEAVGPLITFHEREQARDMAPYVFRALLKAGTKPALDYAREKLRRGEGWERQAILDAVGEYPADDLANDIRMSLVDRDEGARAAAAHALAAIEGPRCQASLFLLLNDSVPHVRETALTLLASLRGVEGYEDHVTPLLRDSAPKVREAAVKALAALPPSGVVLNELRRMVNEDRDDGVAARAASALVSHNVEEAYPILASISHDSSKGARLRIMVVDILQSTYGARAEEALLPCLDTEPRQVAIAAAAALMQMESQAAAERLDARLRAALAREKPDDAAGDARGGEEHRAEGKAAAQEEDGGETACENEDIVLIGGKKAVRSPGEAPGKLTPAECVYALGGARTALTTQTLVECLSGSNEDLACAAAEALARKNDRTACAALRDALKSDSAPLRLRALKALRALEDVTALPLISCALAEDPDETVRAAAAEALWPADSPDTIARLIGGLSDPSQLARRACVAALGRVTVDRKHVAATLYYVLFDFPRFGDLRSAIYEALRNLEQRQVILSLTASTLKNPECRTDHWVALEAIGQSLT